MFVDVASILICITSIFHLNFCPTILIKFNWPNYQIWDVRNIMSCTVYIIYTSHKIFYIHITSQSMNAHSQSETIESECIYAPVYVSYVNYNHFLNYHNNPAKFINQTNIFRPPGHCPFPLSYTPKITSKNHIVLVRCDNITWPSRFSTRPYIK